MNTGLGALPPYPFQRLDALLQGHEAGAQPYISLAEGDPGLPTPDWVRKAVAQSGAGYGNYTPIRGTGRLRDAIAGALTRRYGLPQGALRGKDQVLATAGAREGVFSVIQALGGRGNALVFANPFYAIYSGAGLLAQMQLAPQGGGPGWIRQIPEEQLSKCSLLMLCSPDNPTGRTLSFEDLAHALELADRHDFAVVADECYADVYCDRPPVGLLEACARLGRTDWRRCLVLHSLSKRAGLTGLRSAAIAGDAELIGALGLYRSYHGVSLAAPIQEASALAWDDDDHVQAVRQGVQGRFAAFARGMQRGGRSAPQPPEGGFYHYYRLQGAWRNRDLEFAVQAHRDHGLRVLPACLMASGGADNPGIGHLRLSIIGPEEHCEQAGLRLARLLDGAPDEGLQLRRESYA